MPEELGIPCRTYRYEGDDALALVVSSNLHRRHLDESQRGFAGARIDALTVGRPSDEIAPIGASSKPKQTLAEIAGMMNVGTTTLDRARAVLKRGAPELVAAVEAGEVKVGAAAEVAKLPEEEQRAVVAEGPAAVREKASAIRKGKELDPAPVADYAPPEEGDTQKAHFPLPARPVSPRVRRAMEEGEKDGWGLSSLKTAWKTSGKRAHAAFLIWIERDKIVTAAVEKGPAATDGPIRYRPAQGLDLMHKAILGIGRITKEDTQYEAAFRGMIDYCEAQLEKAGKR